MIALSKPLGSYKNRPLRPGEEFRWEANRFSSFNNWPHWVPVGPIRLAAAGFSYTGYSDEVLCFSCGGRLKGWNAGDDPFEEHQKYFPQCNFIKGTDVNNVPLIRNPESPSPNNQTPYYAMRDESARIQTYVNWSRDAPVTAKSLAAAGFFYTGNADMVKCAFCGGMIRNFEPGDTAMGEHSKYFPSCSFVKEYLRRNPENHQTIENNPIITERPKYPQYATVQSRLKTFERWPPTKTQRPEDLANAGFFYVKFNDNVKCFFCNGGLRNWEPDDDPWTEHARWFPRCGYVRQCKGVTFITNIAQGTNGHEHQYVVECSPTKNNTTQNKGSRKPSLTPLESAMAKPYSRVVLDLGVSEEIVKQAIQKRLNEKGSDFTNSSQLLDAVYEIEDAIEDGLQQPPIEGAVGGRMDPSELEGDEEKENNENVLELEEKTSKTHQNLTDEELALLYENKKLKDQKICKVCKNADVRVLLLPCAHLCVCESCSSSLVQCPVCGAGIRGTVKTYLP